MANEAGGKPLPINLLSFLAKPAEPDLASALASLSGSFAAFATGMQAWQGPPTIQARYFRGETIRVDGYTFERCRFDDCKLVTEMATFTFKNCVVSADCTLYLTGAALKVARLLMHVLRVKERVTTVQGEDAIFAALNEDGTFSLE